MFDQLTCGYKISKRGFDMKKNEKYEYTINFGRFTINNGSVQFGMNVWKSGAVPLAKDYLTNNASIFVDRKGKLVGTFPVFTSSKKEKTKPVTIVSVEKRDINKLEGEFLAIREGKKLEDEAFILKVNSCN